MTQPALQQPTVLFLCTGNSCRSPMAEHLFRLRAGPDSPWRAESAGLAAADGWPASDGAIAAMREVGVDLSAHRSRAATSAMLGAAARVFVMTSGHLREVADRFPNAVSKTRLLSAHRGDRPGGDIADPIGQSVFVYRSVRNEMDSAIADLLLVLRAERAAGGTVDHDKRTEKP